MKNYGRLAPDAERALLNHLNGVPVRTVCMHGVLSDRPCVCCQRLNFKIELEVAGRARVELSNAEVKRILCQALGLEPEKAELFFDCPYEDGTHRVTLFK